MDGALPQIALVVLLWTMASCALELRLDDQSGHIFYQEQD